MTTRVASYDWETARAELDETGWSMLKGALTPLEADSIAASYSSPQGFRSTVVMARMFAQARRGRVRGVRPARP